MRVLLDTCVLAELSVADGHQGVKTAVGELDASGPARHYKMSNCGRGGGPSRREPAADSRGPVALDRSLRSWRRGGMGGARGRNGVQEDPGRSGPHASHADVSGRLHRGDPQHPRLNGRVNPMKWGKYRFGSIKIDGKAYEKDMVLDRGGLRTRKKKPSRISGAVRSHSRLVERSDPLAMQVPGDRHRHARSAAGHGRSHGRGPAARRGDRVCPTSRPSNTFRKTRKRRTRSCM